jgi:Pyridoxamine 5'-phosphate oxidase
MTTTATTAFTPEVERYLRDHHTLTLSTASFTGLPHANTAPYVTDGRWLWFFARPGSVLVANLHGSHHAAFTVDDYSPAWRKRRELHGTGACGLAIDHQVAALRPLCAEKFGDGRPDGIACWLEPVGMYFVDYDE